MATQVTNMLAPTISATSDKVSFESSWALSTWDEEWDSIQSWWEFYYTSDKATSRRWDYIKYGLGGSSTSDSAEFVMNDPRPTWKVYPLGPWTIARVNCWIRGTNEGGWPITGWYYSQDLVIRVPPKPVLSFEVARNATGKPTDLKLSVEKGSYELDYQNAETHNYDTVVRVTKTTSAGVTSVLKNWTAYTDDAEIDLAAACNELSLAFNEWIRVEAEAYGRGCAGDGARVRESHVFAWPATPQIKRVAVDIANGIVLVSLETNASQYHPVDSVSLQRLKDTDKQTADAAALDTGWEDVSGMSDTGDCRGLSDSVTDATPAKGKRTWYRVVAKHDGYTTYSVPVESGLYQPAIVAQAGAAVIMDAKSGDDGTSAIVRIAWNDDEFANVTDPSELAEYEGKTRITWGDTEYAWDSTGGVKSFDVGWEDSTPAYAAYDHSATIYISDLDEGVPVYIRVNRMLSKSDEEIPGPYSNIVKVTPASAPAWVELSAPAYIARGSSLALSWTFGSDAAQTGWMLMDDDGKVWAAGDDASGYAVIGADMLSGVDELALYAVVTTGGDWKRSAEAVTVRIADAPTCSVQVAQSVTDLPVEIKTTAPAGTTVSIYAVSRGVTYAEPTGTKVQYSGDIVWSGTASGGAGVSTKPDGAAFVDRCTYEIRACATDETTGLKSDIAIATCVMAWDDAPGVPAAAVTVDADAMQASIEVTAPDDAADGDTCEVYRVTPDGAVLIASGVEFGSKLIDRFAPFASAASDASMCYRVCTRTEYGTCAWRDVTYGLAGESLRLDWDGKHLELPYSIGISEAFSKDFESRKHMDGSIGGYWEAGTERKADVSTEIIRFESREQEELLRDLARYAGAVFVRTPGGLAFDANVEVSKVEEEHDKGVIGVSLDISEIGLTESHKVSSADIEEPAGEAEVS